MRTARTSSISTAMPSAVIPALAHSCRSSPSGSACHTKISFNRETMSCFSIPTSIGKLHDLYCFFTSERLATSSSWTCCSTLAAFAGPLILTNGMPFTSQSSLTPDACTSFRDTFHTARNRLSKISSRELLEGKSDASSCRREGRGMTCQMWSCLRRATSSPFSTQPSRGTPASLHSPRNSLAVNCCHRMQSWSTFHALVLPSCSSGTLCSRHFGSRSAIDISS
mmetsp:Transcript_55880/g.133188  ORF Transcript_55880/g.133188 Transcript_55880/m.133188 type:complete len:224 (+) Transcript_55880:77-748(+)